MSDRRYHYVNHNLDIHRYAFLHGCKAILVAPYAWMICNADGLILGIMRYDDVTGLYKAVGRKIKSLALLGNATECILAIRDGKQ